MNAHVLSQLCSLFACCFTLLVLLLAQDGQLAHESLSAEDKLSVASATVSLTATAWWTPSKKQLGTAFGFGFTQDQFNPAHNWGLFWEILCLRIPTVAGGSSPRVGITCGRARRGENHQRAYDAAVK